MSIVSSTDEEINAVFDVYDTGGEGDCLFYSLGFGLHNQLYTPEEAFNLRQAICKETALEINGVPMQAFVVVAEVHGETDMCNQGTWGGDAEIMKAAKLFNRPIIVYEQNRTDGLAEGIVVPELAILPQIRAGTYCPRMQQYFTAPHFANVLNRMYTFHLPQESNESEPLLILNIGGLHYRILKPKGSYVGIQSHGASLSNLASLSQISKLEHQALALFESLTSGAPEDEIIEQAKVSMPQKLIDVVFAEWKKLSTSSGSYTGVQPASESSSSGASLSNLAALSLPQVAQPILSKPEPTVEDYEELMALLETVRGNVKEINRIVREAESKMQIPEEIIEELFNMFK